MKTTTLYRQHPSGRVEKIEVERRSYKESYDSIVSVPMHQRILNSYYASECEQKLRPNDIIKSKSYVKRVHEQALAEGR